MRHGCHALGLEICHRLDDLVTQIDPADAFVALLNAGRLAVNLDLEPDAADASRLDREIARLSGNAGVGLVTADDRIQRAVAADLLVDHDVDVNVALGFQTCGQQAFHRHDMARNSAFHVRGTAPINTAVLYGGGPWIVTPSLPAAHRDDIGMPVQEQGSSPARAL